MTQSQHKVIASDLDGTLFYPKAIYRMVNRKNRHFVRRAIKDGTKIVLVTSRSHNSAEKVRKFLKVPVDFVGANGTFIDCGGEIVKEWFFDPDEITKLVYEMYETYKPRVILATTKRFPIVSTKTYMTKFNNFLYWTYLLFQGSYREPYVRDDHVFFNEIKKGECYKIMMMVGLNKKAKLRAKQITEELSEKYPQFEFAWIEQFVEITPKGCSKASGLSFYLDYQRISHDNVIVVGDSGNDFPMFDAFHENSYCMAHSPKSVRSRASHVISRVSDLEQVLYPSEDSNPRKKKKK